jgi:predicted phosphodiesterase
MIRFIYFFKQEKNLKKLLSYALKELELFQDYESITQDYIEQHDDLVALIVGHTHEPRFRPLTDGRYFINSGTWTQMHFLDFNRGQDGKPSYVQIDYGVLDKKTQRRKMLDISLSLWQGKVHKPYTELFS